MRARARPVLALVVAATITAGCSGTTTDDPATSEAASPVAVDVSPTPQAPTVDTVAFVTGLNDEVVVQTSPVEGGGDRPVLAWEAFDGAADYVVVVHDADDEPYWAWTTSDTEVRVGLTERPDTAPGPRVAEGMHWVVIARDGEGVPIASSPRRPIAP